MLDANADSFSQHELDELMVDYLSSHHRFSHRNKLSRNPPTGWEMDGIVIAHGTSIENGDNMVRGGT